jgi:hypothetical protein
VSLGYLEARRKGLLKTVEGLDNQIAELQLRLGLRPVGKIVDKPPVDKMVHRAAVTKGV